MPDPLLLRDAGTATPIPPFWAMSGRVIRAGLAAIIYALLFAGLVLAAGLVSVAAANSLPGIIAFENTRVVVITTSAVIVLILYFAYFLQCIDHGPRVGLRTLVRRSRHLLGLLGVRRSPHQTLTAIWFGFAGGELALGLGLLLLSTVLPATHGDVRSAAIANVTPVIGGAFYAIHAALWEEILWRGLLLLAVAAVVRQWSSRRTQLAATLILLILSSAAFGYDHLTWSTTNAVTAGIDGLIFGTLALQQRSIWPAVIAHAAMNFTLVIIT